MRVLAILAVGCALAAGCGGRGLARETVPLPKGLDPSDVVIDGPWADGEGNVVHLFHDGPDLMGVDRENRKKYMGAVRERRLVLRGREGVIGEDARRIRWNDGTVWTRTLAGIWVGPGKRTHQLRHLGKEVLALDVQEAEQVEGTVEDRVVTLKGKRGAVSADYRRIDWGDGQTWTKQ